MTSSWETNVSNFLHLAVISPKKTPQLVLWRVRNGCLFSVQALTNILFQYCHVVWNVTLYRTAIYQEYRVYPMKYAHRFVLLRFSVVSLQLLGELCYWFTQIIFGCFNVTGVNTGMGRNPEHYARHSNLKKTKLHEANSVTGNVQYITSLETISNNNIVFIKANILRFEYRLIMIIIIIIITSDAPCWNTGVRKWRGK